MCLGKRMRINKLPDHTPLNVKYSFERGFRNVQPYMFEYKKIVQREWDGKTLLSFLQSQIRSHVSSSDWIDSLRSGDVLVNNEIVTIDYSLQNRDIVFRRSHRHEPPIYGNITFVGENDELDLLAINKPSSYPMHACGAYRFNTVQEVLMRDPASVVFPIDHKRTPLSAYGQSFHIVHRLDRVTSGLVVLAKTKEAASIICKEIKSRATTKVYLARVKGNFPFNMNTKIRRLEVAAMQEKYIAETQLDEYEVDTTEPELSSSASDSDMTDILQENLFQCSEVGYVLVDNVRKWDVANITDSNICSLVLSCPVRLLSSRDGVYTCSTLGKSALSTFKNLGYDSVSDTSLVECRPLTGRTHQVYCRHQTS